MDSSDFMESESFIRFKERGAPLDDRCEAATAVTESNLTRPRILD